MPKDRDRDLNSDTQGKETPKTAHTGAQPGAQQHAEGAHGDRTHARHIEQLNETPQRETRDEKIARDRVHGERDGRRRLVEDRQQHDEAEKDSEMRKTGRGRDA